MANRPPNVLVETAGLSRENWLTYRRLGIGGSDAASVLGISPFRTGVDLYYDKLGQFAEDTGKLGRPGGRESAGGFGGADL